MSRIDVNQYSKRLGNEISKIKESDQLKETDKQTLTSFAENRKQNSSDGRIASELNRLRRTLIHNSPGMELTEILEKQEIFQEINKQISQSEMHHQNGDYANSTKDEYRKAWKRLLEYHYQDQDKVEEFLPRNYSQNTHSLGENIDPRKTPGPEDVKQLCQSLEAICDPKYARRNVAAAMTLWDSGCRISGLLRMNVGDITYRNGTIEEVMIPAVKDSPRRPVELTVATPILQNYLENIHPEPSNDDAPLFCTLKNGEVKRLLPADFRQKLLQARAHTGLNIKFNPHNWRRGRGTFLVVQDIFDVRTAATRGGWSKIETLDGYLQQTMSDVNKKTKQVYKSEKVDDTVSGPEADLLPLTCPNCSQLNTGFRDRCRSCGTALDKTCIPDGVKEDGNRTTLDQIQKVEKELEQKLASLREDL